MISYLLTGIAYENDGGALKLETYSEASIDNCLFEGNEAANIGGAISIKILSVMKLHDSILRHNKAKYSGGSILLEHSRATIESCTFSNESVIYGNGGAIIAENTANVTIQASSFYNCMAWYGGSISVAIKSVLNIENSNLSDSFAKQGGHFLHFPE